MPKKGISLIVMIITIIIALIIVGVVIISINDNNLFVNASKAVRNTNENNAKHIATIAWADAYSQGIRDEETMLVIINDALQKNNFDINDYLITVTSNGVNIQDKSKIWIQNGLIVKKGNTKLEVGDLFNYELNSNVYSGSWKVLGAEDGNLLILSDNTTYVNLKGVPENSVFGITNGKDRLYEISKKYGVGIGVVGTRNINMNDINKITNYSPVDYGKNTAYEYNAQVLLNWNPDTQGELIFSFKNGNSSKKLYNNGYIYIDLNNMTKKTVQVGDNTNLPKLTNSFYTYNVNNTGLMDRSYKACEMLFGPITYNEENDTISYSGTYWTEDTCLRCIGTDYRFGMFFVRNGSIQEAGLYTSTGSEGSFGYYGRAVVKLSNDINIKRYDEEKGWIYTI